MRLDKELLERLNQNFNAKLFWAQSGNPIADSHEEYTELLHKIIYQLWEEVKVLRKEVEQLNSKITSPSLDIDNLNFNIDWVVGPEPELDEEPYII